MKAHTVGIDLGTSYSSLARINDQGAPEVLCDGDGENMTPSAVFVGDEIVVGRKALELGREAPERLIEHAKRYLGAPRGWEIDGVVYTPVDVSAFILAKLKEDAERQFGPIGRALLTVPVHFSAYQRKLTVEAACQAKLELLGLANEPSAAALTYILGEHGLAYTGLADERTLLVYDLGGGTFDLSLVHYGEEGITVRAATGDLQLGGIDWNQRLVDVVADQFRGQHGTEPRQNTKLMRQLIELIEEAKRTLSNPSKSATQITITYQGRQEVIHLTRDEFEFLTDDLVARTEKLTAGLLKSAGVHWHRLDQLLPVGGATRMPMIRRLLERMCDRFMPRGFRPNYQLSPDLAVAQGAALYARLMEGDDPSPLGLGGRGLHELVPEIASPRSVALVVRDGTGQRVKHVLVPRGRRLPVTARVVVGTVSANQSRINLRIVEADDESGVEDGIICRCAIADLPEGLPEESLFDVELTYEPSGLLQVIAKHRDSGRLATASLVCPG
jgi:molecular chaperone DnaK